MPKEYFIKTSLWSQFGAAMDMLENALKLCPDSFWDTEARFWYKGYHCLFYLDYYLTLKPEEFMPPEPFTLSEFEDILPERVYTREELLKYLRYNKEKCRVLISGLSVGALENRWVNQSGTMDYSIFEILIYNLRHVQHHAAQLNMLLRQGIDDAPDWVFKAGTKLEKGEK